MVLSEAEAEAQLAALRRQREALDRSITDLTLYLELGRRLTGTPLSPADKPAAPSSSRPESWPSPDLAKTEDREVARRLHPHASEPPSERRLPSPSSTSSSHEVGSGTTAPNPPDVHTAGAAGIGIPDHAPMEDTLSAGTLARRYGRALIEAALAVLDEAGRPLHAGEILAVLTSRGFSLPGHDPVAALNTRLWKRSGPGGPLKRMGDAIYALVEPEDDDVARK